MAAEPQIQPVYVLFGEDAFLRDRHRERIVREAVGDADPQLCVVHLDGSAELAAVLDELRTLPFLAPRRVVILHEADAFVSAHRAALENFLASPPSSASLVLLVSSWPKNTRLHKLVSRIGEAVECKPPAGEDLAAWLIEAAGRRGKKLGRDAAELLIRQVEGDLARLDAEIEKLSLYVGERTSITAEDVGELVVSSAGPAAFALTNALTAGDAPGALKALSGMLTTRGEEFKVMGMLAWHLRKMLAAARQARSGGSPEQALGRMPYRQKQAAMALLRRRGVDALRRDFRALLETDLAMKSGTPATAALQTLLVRLCN